MSAEAPQPNPQEAYRGVSHEQAAKQLGRTLTQAALGVEGGYQPDLPVLSDRHTAKVDKTTIGDYDTTHFEAQASNSLRSRYDEAWRSLDVATKKGDSFNSTEIAVDAVSGKAIETKMKNRERTKTTPSTRRLMAADRLAKHKFGLNKDEAKAA